MARPRVFVSSTYYDLKHVRSSLELFVESLGFEPVLSEKGDIAYSPDDPLDESCYREAASADMFVLVIGGRYGSEVSAGDLKAKRTFYEKYESITKQEFETAYDNGIPVFVLIESAVYAEYQTFLMNRSNEKVIYAHVDSVNVFRFIETILVKQRNNPVFQFERSSQIEAWLREQWSGLFRELLRNRSQQKQLGALTAQVSDLKSVNETLKTYLEAVLNQVTPETSEGVIAHEEKRLEEQRKFEQFKKTDWFMHLDRFAKLSEQEARDSVTKPTSGQQAIDMLRDLKSRKPADVDDYSHILATIPVAQDDFNTARSAMGLDHLDFTGVQAPGSQPASRQRRGSKKTDTSSQFETKQQSSRE